MRCSHRLCSWTWEGQMAQWGRAGARVQMEETWTCTARENLAQATLGSEFQRQGWNWNSDPR